MAQEWTPPPQGGVPPTVPNYLVLAILSVFCCTPMGIGAVIFSTQVNSKMQQGDIAGAQESSKKAKMFAFISIGVGVVVYAISIILGLVLGVAGNM